MKNFWQNLSNDSDKPFFVLAPMEDVTDVVFRSLVKQANLGRPEVLFTEFTNCDGICSVGQARVIHRLKYDAKVERPIVAQIWGKTPQNYQQTAKLCLEMGFDGVDINMGCPERNVIKQGCCSALINNHTLAKEIIEATQAGVNGEIPVSVKTRLGFKELAIESWFGFLLQQNLQAITIHGRTVNGSDQPANWSHIAKVVQLRNLHENLDYKPIQKQKQKALKQQWLDLIG